MEILSRIYYKCQTLLWPLQSPSAQSREATRKHRTDITAQGDVVAVLRKPQALYQTPSSPCPGCGANRHRGGRVQCPAYDQQCALYQKIGHFARVCRSKRPTNPLIPQSQISTNAIRIQSPQGNHFQLYKMKQGQHPQSW